MQRQGAVIAACCACTAALMYAQICRRAVFGPRAALTDLLSSSFCPSSAGGGLGARSQAGV